MPLVLVGERGRFRGWGEGEVLNNSPSVAFDFHYTVLIRILYLNSVQTSEFQFTFDQKTFDNSP